MQPVELKEDTSFTPEMDDTGHLTLWQLPKILWAAMLVFGLNLGLAFTVLLGPELHVDMYGAQEHVVRAAESKPSPFIGTPEEKPRKVRGAEKLTPVLVETGVTASFHPVSYASTGAPALITND